MLFVDAILLAGQVQAVDAGGRAVIQHLSEFGVQVRDIGGLNVIFDPGDAVAQAFIQEAGGVFTFHQGCKAIGRFVIVPALAVVQEVAPYRR